METAINIACTSKLFYHDTHQIILKTLSNPEDCKSVLRNALEDIVAKSVLNHDGQPCSRFAIVVDGESWINCFAYCPDLFLDLLHHCHTMVCCRMSPAQKAQVVRLVKRKLNKVCLSIGDGANDVSMIREANVGIGVQGKEGTQAVMASDYVIHQFKHLQRLLLVHGRFSHLRVAKIIYMSFFKNMAFNLPQFYFAFSNGFTGQTLFISALMSVFNPLFTDPFMLIMGFQEQDISASFAMKYPQVFSTLPCFFVFCF